MNETLLIVGYGSLLSGHGLLTIRRQGKSRLLASQAFPILLRNARRGLAKPTAHGHYLAMDLEPVTAGRPLAGRVGIDRMAGEIGALGLVFDRRWATDLARREEYDAGKFLELIELADRQHLPIGEYLLRIAQRTNFHLLAYREALAALLGYTSPGYIFHPLPLDDGRVGLVAIGSGFEGSGDPAVRSRRSEAGIAQLMSLPGALGTAHRGVTIDPAGQLGYFVECLLGGVHGLWVGDLIQGLDGEAGLSLSLARLLAETAAAEPGHFLTATALTPAIYSCHFGTVAHSGLAPLIDQVAPGK